MSKKMKRTNKITKLERLSEFLKLDSKIFKNNNILNSIVGIDSELYVDPVLLKKTTIFELKDSYEKIREHFKLIFEAISFYIKEEDNKIKESIYSRLVELMTFKETDNTFIGVSKNGSNGKGIGKILAKKCLDNAIVAFTKGIKDPLYFEILPVFSDGIGKDLVSDMIISIIKEDIIKYNKRIALSNSLDYEKDFVYDNKPLFLLPNEILVDQQLSYWFSTNDYFKKTMNRITSDNSKLITIKNQKQFEEVIKIYEEKSLEHTSYDFNKDGKSIINWFSDSLKIVSELEKQNTLNTELTLLENSIKLCNDFKHIIENNGLNILLFNESESGGVDYNSPKKEKYAQRLFAASSNEICNILKINLSAEIDTGSGYVDFELTNGEESVVIEFKLANKYSSLVNGYSKQLEKYKIAEKTEHGIFVVISNGHNNSFENVEKFKQYLSEEENLKKGTTVIYIDASKKISASKL